MKKTSWFCNFLTFPSPKIYSENASTGDLDKCETAKKVFKLNEKGQGQPRNRSLWPVVQCICSHHLLNLHASQVKRILKIRIRQIIMQYCLFYVKFIRLCCCTTMFSSHSYSWTVCICKCQWKRILMGGNGFYVRATWFTQVFYGFCMGIGA